MVAGEVDEDILREDEDALIADAMRVAETRIEVNGEELLLDAAGAPWWPRETHAWSSPICISRKARSMRAPASSCRPTTRAPPCPHRSPRGAPRAVRMIALGDSFHDRYAAERLDEEERALLATLREGRECIWIAGNHDPDPPPWLGGAWPKRSRSAVWCSAMSRAFPCARRSRGHLHPCATVRPGPRLRRRCFVSDGKRLLMPAFGAYAGGLDVGDRAVADCFGTNSSPICWVLRGVYDRGVGLDYPLSKGLSMSAAEILQIAKAGWLETVTLNRPERLNAINQPLADALLAFFEIEAPRQRHARDCRGRCRPAFCAGADLKAMGQPDALRDGPNGDWVLRDTLKAMRDCPQPVIALVQGSAAGGGLALALAADVILAAENAAFHPAFIKIGLSGSELGVSWRLQRTIGISRAREMLLTGQPMPAGSAADRTCFARRAGSRIVEAWPRIAEAMLRASPDALRVSNAPSMQRWRSTASPPPSNWKNAARSR